MENLQTLNGKFKTVAWGLLFVWWGITLLDKSLPDGTGLVGSGLILIGLNIARSWKGIPTNGFTTVLGILALVWGGLELARPIMHLPFDLPVFAILLIALGVILLVVELLGILKTDFGDAR